MRFFFERDFDRELEIERGDAPLTDPSVEADALAAQIDAAWKAAFAEGAEVGAAAAREEMRRERDARHTDAMARVGEELDRLTRALDTHRANLESDLVDFAVAICERLLPEAVDLLSERRLRAEMIAGLRLVQGEGQCRIRVSPEFRDVVAEDMERMGGAAANRVEVLPDPALAAGDARVEWDNGFMEYSFADTCSRLIGALNDIAASPARPALEGRKTHV